MWLVVRQLQALLQAKIQGRKCNVLIHKAEQSTPTHCKILAPSPLGVSLGMCRRIRAQVRANSSGPLNIQAAAVIWRDSKRGLQVAGLQAVTKNFQHFLPKNLEVWNWPPYVWPCNVSTTNQQKRMKILNTINPHPTRAAHDGRYRREHSTKTWGSSRGQKANRSKRAADAMPCQFMRDAAKARTYDERRAKRKRTA
jgi:hypothetical protein